MANTEKKNTIMLGTRVSESTYEAVKDYLTKSDCINTSDLLRRALSEYLEKRIQSLNNLDSMAK